MTVTLPLVVGGVEDPWIYPRRSNDGYLCGYGDTERAEGRAIGVEDKIRVRVLLVEKKRPRQKRTAGIVVAPALEEFRRPSCVLRRRQQGLL
jgi:hypothetical protein